MTYYYIHVVAGRGGGDGRFSLPFHCSELATPNQSDLKECGDVCACARWRMMMCVGICFCYLTCLYCKFVHVFQSVERKCGVSSEHWMKYVFFLSLSFSPLTFFVVFSDDNIWSLSP